MRKLAKWVVAAVAGLAAAPASATWLKAETAHFIIYVDTDEAKARRYATRLEGFDAALRRLYGVADDPARRSNRVQVFAFRPGLFQKTCGCYGVLGYYSPAAGGSAIVSMYTGDVDKTAPAGAMTSQTILLHEYSHHFMYANFPIAYPLWYSEGFAEFNANVLFNDDGSITIGLPANYRADAIQDDHVGLNVCDFFAGVTNMMNHEFIYGRGWIMTHYLTLSSERPGQLAAYLTALNGGKSSWEAAVAAFGDPQRLFADTGEYRKRKHLAAPLRVPAPAKPPVVTITRLGDGEAALLPLRARLAGGAVPAEAKKLLAQARTVAADHPRDALAQTWLARAALGAGDLAAAEVAADAAIAALPEAAEAMLVKGEVAIGRLVAAKSGDAAAWTAARGWLLKANHADPDAARPLLLYYRSYVEAHVTPPPGAVRGLSRAVVLAPEDSGAHLLLARQLLGAGDAKGARQLLQPIAYAPHGREGENTARQAIALIDAGKAAEAEQALAAAPADKKA